MSLPFSLALALLSAGGLASPATQMADRPTGASQTSAALTANRQFLILVDGANYGEAWRESSPMVQRAVTEEKFTQATAAVRDPLGAVENRKLTSVVSQTTLPGAPDGHYVIAEYSTTFAHKKDAVETIVSAESEGGDWQVAGYHIH